MITVDRYTLLVLWSIIFVLLSGRLAHSQSDGYSIAPDGTVSSWDRNGGYSVSPQGSSSWDQQGGYSTQQGISSWSGPVLPIVPAQPGVGQQFLIQPDPDPLPPLP